MKKNLKSTLALVLCLLMLMSTAAVSFAASVGAVKALKVSAVSDVAVKVKWNAASGASGYQVERSTDGKTWTQIAKTTALTYKDTNVDAGAKYIYRVRGYKGQTTGSYSGKLNVLTKPEKVEAVTAKVKDGATVALSWEAAAGATVYKIYRKDSFTDQYKAIGTSKTTKFTVTSKYATGKTYYCVQSYAKKGGMTSFSALGASAKVTLKPGTVGAVVASNQTSSGVLLHWDAAPGANQYVIYQRVATGDSSYQKIGTTKKTSYQVKFDAAPGTVYFRVCSMAVKGEKSIAGAYSPLLKLSFKPKKVAALTLKEAAYNSLTLLWTKADGASDYLVYNVNAAGKRTLIGQTKETTFKVENLEPATTYTYTVRAVAETANNTLYTDYSPTLTAATTFGTVATLKYSLDSNNQLYLLWDALADVEGYEVEKLVNGNWKLIGNVKSTTFDATGAESSKKLTPGTDYSYRVRAYVKDGGEMVYSSYSEPLTVRAVPEAPKNIKTGTGADHSVVLEWDAVPGAEMYEVYYYDNNIGEWLFGARTPGSAYVNSKGESRVYYIEKGIEATGDYQYRIRSVVLNGEDPTEGGYHGKFSPVVTHHYIYSPEPEDNFAPGIEEAGVLGYLYDEKEDVFYTANNPWQRNFGFNRTYDFFSQFVMIQYDTKRFEFKHQGSDWMIQPWKGQYGMVLYGGEVGVYRKYTERNVNHYDCVNDEDRLMMSLSAYHYVAETKEWVHDFDRPYATYWWVTGFVMGYIRFIDPATAQNSNNFPDLRLDVRITVKDFEMLEGLTKEMKAQGVDHTVSGLDVYFSF